MVGTGSHWGLLALVVRVVFGGSFAAQAHGNGTLWPAGPWKPATPQEVGMEPASLARARDYALTGEGSGLVTRYGMVVLPWGDQSRIYDLKSSTKAIGVTAVGLALLDRKFLSLHDLASRYHPEFASPPRTNEPNNWRGKITLFHLATQTAGFDKPGGYSELLFDPGTKWSYSDSGPNWLAECVTLAYGRDLQDLMFERVFEPIGIGRKDLIWETVALLQSISILSDGVVDGA